MLGLAIGSGVAGIAGGLLGAASAADEREQAKQFAEKAASQYEGLTPPQLQQLILENIVQQGTYDPEAERGIQLGDTQMGGISLDPRMREAQFEALEKLKQVGEEGLTAQDRVVLEQGLSRAAQQANARKQAVMQSMQRRGMGGSGQELVAALQAEQGGAQLAQQAGLTTSAMAQQRALEGIMGAGQMGGQMRSQEFGEQADIARAQDIINQFNTQGLRDVQARNVAQRNLAQQQNLFQQQRIHEANIAQRTGAQQYANQLANQNFQQQLGLAQGRAGAYGAKAAAAQQAGQQQAQMWSGLGGAAAGAMGSVAQAQSDKAWQDIYKQKLGMNTPKPGTGEF